MAEATEADRKRAVALLREASADGLIGGPAEPGKQPEMVERLAAALADERASAVAEELRAVAMAVRNHMPGYIGRDDTARSLEAHAAALDPT